VPAAKPKLPTDFADKTWGKLQAAVSAVHQKRAVSCSLEDLYRVSSLSKGTTKLSSLYLEHHLPRYVDSCVISVHAFTSCKIGLNASCFACASLQYCRSNTTCHLQGFLVIQTRKDSSAIKNSQSSMSLHDIMLEGVHVALAKYALTIFPMAGCRGHVPAQDGKHSLCQAAKGSPHWRSLQIWYLPNVPTNDHQSQGFICSRGH